MPYATQDDLVPRRMTAEILAQLTDDSGGAEIQAQVVTDIFAEASGKIDSYCRLRYIVPLQPSQQLTGLALDIGVYLLYSRRDRVTDGVRAAYDDAIKFLKDVAAGNAGLDQPANQPAQSGGGNVLVTVQEERFSDDNLKGFI